jgi:predicted nucleotidyltransferase
MNKLILNNIDTIKELCKKYEVKSMYLFGSSSKGEFRETSDIDILITFHDIPIDRYTDNYFELHYELEALFNRDIDLITEKSLSNPYLIKSIEETKQLLYAA